MHNIEFVVIDYDIWYRYFVPPVTLPLYRQTFPFKASDASVVTRNIAKRYKQNKTSHDKQTVRSDSRDKQTTKAQSRDGRRGLS